VKRRILSVRQTLAEKRQHFAKMFSLPSNDEDDGCAFEVLFVSSYIVNFSSDLLMSVATLPFQLSHLLLYLLVSFTFPFSLSYSLNPFSCFSISSDSTKIATLHFQAGCRGRRLNLAFVFVDFMLYVFLVKDVCFLPYLI